MPRRFECGRLLPCAVLLVATVARCGGGSAPVYSPPDTHAPAADVPDAIPDAQDVDPGASTPADAGPTDLRRSFDRGGTPVVRDTETPTDVDEPAKDAPDVSPARDDATEDPDPGAADVEATIDEGPCADTCASLTRIRSPGAAHTSRPPGRKTLKPHSSSSSKSLPSGTTWSPPSPRPPPYSSLREAMHEYNVHLHCVALPIIR